MQRQSCSLLTVAHLNALYAPCAKCKQSRVDARLKSFAFFFSRVGSKRKQIQTENTFKSGKAKTIEFLLMFSVCDSVAFGHDCHLFVLFFFEGDLRTFDSIAFDSAGLLCSHSQGCFSIIFSLIFFISIANFWLVFRIVFELF